MKPSALYFECASGISGDMTVGALLDLGADRDYLLKQLATLPVEGYRIDIEDVAPCGIRATAFRVHLDHDAGIPDYPFPAAAGGHDEIAAEEADPAHAARSHTHEQPQDHGSDHDHGHAHRHGHGVEHHDHHGGHSHHDHGHGSEHQQHHDHGHSHEHGGDHVHRNLRDITAIIEASGLTEAEQKLALSIFTKLAEAEAYVHRRPVDQIYFHEVGAVDAIVDICAAAVCLSQLGIRSVIIPGVSEGHGYADCAHGRMPVPVPAVVRLLETHGIPIRPMDVPSELVTPTGAAIACAVRTHDRLPASYRIVRSGAGAGTKSFEFPNILRAMELTDDAD